MSSLQNSIPSIASHLIRPHYDAFIALPEPNTKWRAEDIPPYLFEHLSQLQDVGAVHQVKAERKNRTFRWVYETDEAFYEAVQNYEREGTLVMPCGHGGMRNIDGEVFECNWDHCGERFPRTVVEDEVFGNG